MYEMSENDWKIASALVGEKPDEWHIDCFDDTNFFFLHYIGKETDGSKIKIPDGLESCEFMFNYCRNLKTPPVIPDSVIDCYCMFKGCSSLEEPPVIPNSVKIFMGMFDGCNVDARFAIAKAVLSDNDFVIVRNLVEKKSDEWAINGDDGTLRYIGKETDGSKIKIPDGLESCEFMFNYCLNLKTPPVIPDSVEDCSDMFRDCKSLEEPPVIPDSVTNCRRMFCYCKNLKEPPVIPDGVTNCSHMFYNCNSLEVRPVIPDSVKIRDSMFEGCVNLKESYHLGSDVTVDVGNKDNVVLSSGNNNSSRVRGDLVAAILTDPNKDSMRVDFFRRQDFATPAQVASGNKHVQLHNHCNTAPVWMTREQMDKIRSVGVESSYVDKKGSTVQTVAFAGNMRKMKSGNWIPDLNNVSDTYVTKSGEERKVKPFDNDSYERQQQNFAAVIKQNANKSVGVSVQSEKQDTEQFG